MLYGGFFGRFVAGCQAEPGQLDHQLFTSNLDHFSGHRVHRFTCTTRSIMGKRQRYQILFERHYPGRAMGIGLTRRKNFWQWSGLTSYTEGDMLSV